VGQILDLYGFLVVILRGLTLALETVTAGGIIFLSCVDPSGMPEVTLQCRRMLRVFALMLGAVAICSTVLTTLVLRATTEGFRWISAVHTSYFRAEILIALAGVLIALLSLRAAARWLLPFAAAAMIGALLTSHAFGRVEGRSLLLFCTGLHYLATASWIGGLPWLLVALGRGDEEFALLTARRFSRVAMISVPVLIVAGVILGREYVGASQAVYGTAYGIMLATKIVLFSVLLTFGAINFKSLRREDKAHALIRLLVRRSVEVEFAIGITVILTASSMASQPPAVDLVGARLSVSEIAERFTPRWPRLKTPSVAELSPPTPLTTEEAQRFGRTLSYTPGTRYEPASPADVAWSEYNHNWAGIWVLLMSVLALISQTRFGPWARHWPLAFLGLGLFVLIRADPENWPLGPRGFWESFQAPDVMQHRIAVGLIAAFAIFEWRVMTGRRAASWHSLVFPAICMMGGSLLLTHTHSLGNVKEELLAEMNHTAIAIFAVGAAGARWLELRLRRRPTLFGRFWAACFVAIGLLLTFYREG
jgi:putative copper resistance protein D